MKMIVDGRCRFHGGAHCQWCREHAGEDVFPVECPHGIKRGFRLGDFVEKLAKPIAKALGLSCLEPNGKLKPASPCAQRRDALNRLTK